MNEHGFIKAVHPRLPTALLRWKINDSYAGGVPDAFYAGAARCLFVEYKYIKLPVRNKTICKFGLSEQQKLWLNKMDNLGHPVAVVVGSSEFALILTKRKWNTTIDKATFLRCSSTIENVSTFIYRHCWQHEHEHEEGFFSGGK